MAFFWAEDIKGAGWSVLDSPFGAGLGSDLGAGLGFSAFGSVALVSREDPFPPFDPFPLSALVSLEAWVSGDLGVF